ncbi:protein arginine kinase [Garciella nitratireducens]|uniref:Protein-arginine kinase n=1 Tax=Garciella nitratireducens DSM 15102 TaxID=1121911 RepID=A0A1T4PLW1_9FIRM|nr:protein arginine kinase [Garciella nitratireducens]SJZ92341.1 protein arginine kinase [Garciella nitratireducens DSM 15102]
MDWKDSQGKDNDIVITSRIRLARNIKGMIMPTFMDEQQAKKVMNAVYDSVVNSNSAIAHQFQLLEMSQLPLLEKQVLVEKHLISLDLAQSKIGSVLIQQNEQISIMINEEDHIRIQCILPGFQLNHVWDIANKVDDLLEERLSFAFDGQWGYITACPTNLGTGMRASVMLHLPCLMLTGQIDSLMQAMTKLGLTMRGLYGEGSEFLGDLFQISNQITLGSSEQEIISKLCSVVKETIKRERQLREEIKNGNFVEVEDKIYRSYGILQNARLLSSEECMKILSYVRLGIDLGYIKEIDIETINHLMIYTQAGMLQKNYGKIMDEKERDFVRTQYIREKLKNSGGV